jgi:hypothetical protein
VGNGAAPDVHQGRGRDKVRERERKMHLVDLRLSKSERAMILVIGDSVLSPPKLLLRERALESCSSLSMCFCEKRLLANLIRSVYI